MSHSSWEYKIFSGVMRRSVEVWTVIKDHAFAVRSVRRIPVQDGSAKIVLNGFTEHLGIIIGETSTRTEMCQKRLVQKRSNQALTKEARQLLRRGRKRRVSFVLRHRTRTDTVTPEGVEDVVAGVGG